MTMKHYRKQEQGLTLISYVFLLLFIGFFVMLILKITPIYMDHGKVTSALDGLKEMPDLEKQSAYAIKKSLDKRFNMNYVYDVEAEDISIIKRGNYVRVDIEYEVVEPVVSNLSLLVQFHDFVEVGEK
jgi:hypothetical protein